MSASNLLEIGSRGFAFRSCREYGNHGITAVMRLADASRAAWIMNSSSMMFWSTGRHPGLDDEHVGAANRLAVPDSTSPRSRTS